MQVYRVQNDRSHVYGANMQPNTGCSSSDCSDYIVSMGMYDKNDVCQSKSYSDNKDMFLLKYNDIPHFLQGNPWITNGYRVSLPYQQCVLSLFIWSNETINIWSHLLGSVLFLILMLYDNLIEIPRANGEVSDHIVITVGLLCYQLCMLCSAGFHLFCCHSERTCHRWLQADMIGISVGIIGCYFPAVHYAFYCSNIWRDFYMMTVSLLAVSTVWFQVHPVFFKPHWFHVRVVVFIGLVSYGIVPSIHWIFLNGGISEPFVQMFIPRIAVMYLLGLLGFTFYVSKLPERLFPGSNGECSRRCHCGNAPVLMLFAAYVCVNNICHTNLPTGLLDNFIL